MPDLLSGPGARPVAVFDMDGVLVHGDVFGSFLRDRLRRSPAHLAAVAGVWPWLVGPMLAPPTRRGAVRQLLRVALAGLDDATFEARGTRFASELALDPTRVIHQAVERVRELQDDGHHVVVCTACEERVARAYLDGVGLPEVPVLGSLLAFGPLGLRVTRANHGQRKVATLAAAGITAPWSMAFTDALGDLPLLRGASRAVLVNPDDWLRGRVSRALGRTADEVHWPEARRAPSGDRPRVG